MQIKWTVVVAALACGLGGCASQRPLVDVRASGDRALESGEFDKALKDYTEYVDRNPGDAAVQNSLARTLLATEQPALAVEHAWQAFDASPGEDEYIETLAQAMFKAGQISEMQNFLRDQTQGRGRVQDYLRLGRYSAAAGDADSAEVALKTGAELDKGRTLAPQLALADLYRRIGDAKNEVTRLRMALYLDPVNSEVNERLRALGEVPGPSFALQPSETP
jgi:tetratricopeptide (TPR) repeat protein